jgi:hypothetical protein
MTGFGWGLNGKRVVRYDAQGIERARFPVSPLSKTHQAFPAALTA